MIILHDLINNSQAMSKLSLLLSDYSQSLDTLIKQLPNPKLQDQLQHVSQLLLNRDK